MYKSLVCSLLIIALVLMGLESSAQTRSLQVQKGLSTPIKWILPVQQSHVLIGSKNGQLLLWNPSTDQLSTPLAVTQGEINDLLYIPSDEILAIAGSEGVNLYKLQDNEATLLQEIELPNATALYFANQQLTAAASDGVLISGKLASDNWNPTTRLETGISGVFNVKVIGAKLIVVGVHQQKVYDAKSHQLLAEASHYNTAMYASYWDDKNSILYLPREGDVLKLDFSGKQIKMNLNRLHSAEGELVTSLAGEPKNKIVYAATNAGRILKLDKKGHYEQIKADTSNSYTGLLSKDGLLFTGDFYGQTESLETKTWQRVNQVNEDATPGLNGVYATTGGNYFISTHFGARGSALKIWNMRKASLEFAIPVAQQKVYNLSASPDADSVYSFHTDGATWLHVKSNGTYHSSALKDAEVKFVTGWTVSLLDAEPMLLNSQLMEELLQLQDRSGRHELQLHKDQSEKLYLQINKSSSANTSGMPAFKEVQENYMNSGVMPFIQELDIMDRDILYMKLQRKPDQQEFVEIAKGKGIPEKEAMALHQLMHGSNEPSHIVLTDAAGVAFQKILLKKPLKFITGNDIGFQFFFEDELVFWNRKGNKLSRRQIDFTKDAYVYDYMNDALLLADESAIKIYPLQDADTTFTGWVGFENDNYLVYNQDLYYKAKGKSNRVLVSADNGVYPFDAVDGKLNRPDVILGQIPSADSSLAALYGLAIQKRERRDISRNAVYQHQDFNSLLNLEKASAIPLQSKKSKLTPVFKHTDPEKDLVLDYWVNGVKASHAGLAGSKIAPKVALSPGLNKIEWQVSNARKDTILSRAVNYTYYPGPGRNKSKVWYFGAGVNHYADNTMNLNYSTKDINDISKAIKLKYTGATVTTLRDKQVTKQNILKWKNALQKTGINDIVIISFSGHGLLADDTEFYFCTHPTDFSKPAEEGVSISDMVSMLDNSPSRKKLLLIDACQSGLFDEDEGIALVSENAADVSNTRGVNRINRRSTSANANAYSLLQDEFSSLQRHNGTIVISASGGKEYAFESNAYQNGVFTYALLNGLLDKAADANQDNLVSIDELKVYLGIKVQELTKGKQKPTSRQENLGNDWVIW